MAKTLENIRPDIDSCDNKEYLKDLLWNINQHLQNGTSLTFKVESVKESGFLVKVGGLFAFLSFKHFCWSYPTVSFWQNVAKYIVGCCFTCKIHMVSENPIQIKVDAKQHVFKKPILVQNKVYRCVIVQKSKYGFFVDLGLHFNWKFGSILGLIHMSMLTNPYDYDRWQSGEEIETLYHGNDETGKIILGDNCDRAKWRNSELTNLIGTIQKTTVIIDEYGQRRFYVLGEYAARIPLSKEYYSNFRSGAKKFVDELRHGQIIDCEVVKINKRKDLFILMLLKCQYIQVD